MSRISRIAGVVLLAGGARTLRFLLLCLFFVGLILAVTWPWARTFSSGFLDHWDPPFHAWKLNLVAESILQGHVFPPGRTTNVFFPSSLTLYYEALHWPQGVIAAGLRLFTDNVVLVYHLVFVAFWAFSGACFFWLLQELGASATGAVLGAAVFVVMPYRISYRFEFNMQLCAGMVLFLLFLFRFLRDPGTLNALGLSLSFWFQAASELYMALMLVVVAPLLIAPSLRSLPLRKLTGKSRLGICAALLAGGGLTWVFLWPYLVLKRFGYTRGLQEMGQHFVEPLSYLSGLASRTLLPWIHRIRVDELDVYPGTLVLAGVVVYAVSTRKILRGAAAGRGPGSRLLAGIRGVRVASLALLFLLAVTLATISRGVPAWAGPLFNALLVLVPVTTLCIAVASSPADPAARARSGLAGAAALAFLLSLGPRLTAQNTRWIATNEIFEFLNRHLPLLDGMRVVSRFAVVVLVFLVVAAVAGWETLCRRWPRMRWTAALVVLLALAETRVDTVVTQPFAGPWRTPALAALDRDADAPLLVLPVGERTWDSRYMLGIGGSRRRLLYGWGGFFPEYQRTLDTCFNKGNIGGGLRLLGQVWPTPYVLLDRSRKSLRTRYENVDRLGDVLTAACEPVAADNRFALFKVRASVSPAVVYQRITRVDVLAKKPAIVFRARSAAAGDVPAAVAVNGVLLGSFEVTAEPRVYALAVPPSTFEHVGPNVMQIGGTAGGKLVVESFVLMPPGQVPTDARVVTVAAARRHGEPRPAWLGSSGDSFAVARVQ